MSRLLSAALLLLAAVPAVAAEPAPAKVSGHWKFRFEAEQPITFLLAFSEEDGKWVGDFIGASPQLRVEPKVSSLGVKGEVVKFTIELGGREAFNFEGLLAKDGKKLVGAVSKFGGPLEVTELYPSKLKKLTDPVDLAKEDFAQRDGGKEWFDAGFLVASKAADKKLTADDVRATADKLTKAAVAYGSRYELFVALKLANTLASQDGFAEVAVAQAQRAERMLTDDAPASTQMEVLSAVSTALTKAGKAEEAKKYATSLAKLEARDAAEYAKSTLKFDTPEFKGRKAKGDRVALVEVFTGAECPPCVAVDIAFDGLLKTYKPADVVLLQYHVHVPGPDPLTSPEGMERAFKLYGERLSAPSVQVNGKAVGRSGGAAADAAKKYAEFVEAINAELEKPAAAKIALTAAKDDKGVKVTAKVTDLEKPGEKVTLRFAVTEETVRYPGGNGVRFHHHVVRAMPGGIKGFPLTKKEQEQAVVINADDIRKELAKSLDEFVKEQAEFPRPERPLALKNLKVVAFVQDDATNEVLNAVQIDLEAK
jgi:thiol-disulfide isomerase/thioredoxin